MYGLGTNVSSLWFWNLDMGWLWTGDTVYPYLYSMDQASWLLYQTNTASPRLFHNLSTRRWERR
jgi:hypothetical protein